MTRTPHRGGGSPGPDGQGPAGAWKRRRFLQGALSAGALCAARVPFVSAGLASRRPNVLFLAVDDLLPRLGAYGHPDMVTPGIDRLAAAGCLFERAYCQQAVCNPSRSSLMTGWRPDTTRVHDNDRHFRDTVPEAVTLAECFRSRGYETSAFGKIFHGNLDDPRSWSAPWNRVGASPESPVEREGPYTTAGGMRVYREARARAAGSGNRVRGLSHEIQEIGDDQHPDAWLAEAAIRRLRRHDPGPGGRPFFLAVGFRKPHLPFVAPRRYWDLYPEDAVRLDANPFRPEGAPDIALHNWGELRAYADIPGEGPLPEALARSLIRGYCACVSFVDAQVSRLLAELQERNLWENTLVALWGDHGFHLGDKGLWCKHSNFETAVRAPLIIRDPRIPPSVSPGLAEFVDVYPTLCELAGIRPPVPLAGDSQVPAMAGRREPLKDAAFSQYPRGRNIMGYSMRTDRFRFTSWEPVGGGTRVAEELYDHGTDPHETRNLAERPESGPRLAALREELDRRAPRAFPARRRSSG